ncbi:MAG: DUF3006 family protein [bacterium]|nr:DUF3006 family protein [bacterium]MDD5353819.1 DUF3006 family protein [bacterium]
MLGIVDRIEDGKIAVIRIRGGGELVIPVANLPLEIYEGACIDIVMSLDKKVEKLQKKKIKNLQAELLKKNAQKK